MQRRYGCLGVSVLLLVWSSTAHAGIELIEIGTPIHARHLAGIVVDPSGGAIEGAVIEECATAWPAAPPAPELPKGFGVKCGDKLGHVVAWAISDSTGHFVLPRISPDGTHILMIGSAGFDPMKVCVELRLFARKEFRITMHVAT